MSAPEDNFYLTQRELFDEIIQSRIDGKISRQLSEMFILLSTKYSNHRNFVRYYHLKQDLIAAGCEACCKAYLKYRPHKDKEINWDEKTPIVFDHTIHNNCFAYFTTAIHNNFLTVVKSEYNQSNILNELRLESGLDASFGYEEMIAEREARNKRDDDPHSDTDESVWDNYRSVDSTLVDGTDEPNDDDLIDWNEVAQ